jgi:hypothetical protein
LVAPDHGNGKIEKMPQTRQIRADFLFITGGVPPWGLGMTTLVWVAPLRLCLSVAGFDPSGVRGLLPAA